MMDNSSSKACVLLLNLPSGAFCGIDLLSFTTSPRFHGIKYLPPGWHFVFTGVTNSFSLRHGVWFHVDDGCSETSSQQLFVFKWKAESEELVQEPNEAEMLRWRANLGKLWREALTPYRQSAAGSRTEDEHGTAFEDKYDWSKLTNCISTNLLDKILGINRWSTWSLTSAGSAARDYDHIPGLSNEDVDAHHERDLGFYPVDLKQTWREGAVGRERTEAAQDRSWALSNLIQHHCSSPKDLLGELQFCFLMVLTLNNNSCLEQWKRLLLLMLTCKSAVVKQPSFFEEFLACLLLQLEHCQDTEGGLFDLSEEGSSLLGSNLKKFRQGLDQYSGAGKQDVIDELDELEDYLKREHGWYSNEPQVRRGMIDLEDGERIEMDLNGADEEDETGEYAPTVVDLYPNQSKSVHGGPEEPLGRLHGHAGHQSNGEEASDEEDQEVDEMDARF